MGIVVIFMFLFMITLLALYMRFKIVFDYNIILSYVET